MVTSLLPLHHSPHRGQGSEGHQFCKLFSSVEPQIRGGSSFSFNFLVLTERKRRVVMLCVTAALMLALQSWSEKQHFLSGGIK